MIMRAIEVFYWFMVCMIPVALWLNHEALYDLKNMLQ